MISLMLNARLKSLCIVSSFVGRKQSVNLVKEHDKKSLYSMLVKCHEHLHSLMGQIDIMLTKICTNELAIKGLPIFKWFQLDVKNIKCLLQWWDKHEAMFLTIGFLIH